MAVKITARKFGGDDAYSWAVFADGQVVITGLTKSEVPYQKKFVKQLIENRRKTA